MKDNLSIVITILVFVVLIVIFPLYNYFERQDDMSYNLALKETTSFVDQVLNCGYVDQQMYNEFVDKLASTGNIYDIQLESHEKVLSEESNDVYNEQYKISYNNEFFESIEKPENNINERALRNGCYYLNEGDQFFVRLKNTNTTMAGAIFNTIVPTSKKERIVVNYGGIVKNTSWNLVRQEYNALQYLYSVDVEVYVDGNLVPNDGLITITKGEPSYVKWSNVNLEITLENTDNKFISIQKNSINLTEDRDYKIDSNKIILKEFQIQEDNIIRLDFQDQSLKTTVMLSNSDAGNLVVNDSEQDDVWNGYFNKGVGFDIKIEDNKITLTNKKDITKIYTIDCDLNEDFNIRGFKINSGDIVNSYSKSEVKAETTIEIVVGKDGIAEDIYFSPIINTLGSGEKRYYYNLKCEDNKTTFLRTTYLRTFHLSAVTKKTIRNYYKGKLKLKLNFRNASGDFIYSYDKSIFFDIKIIYSSIGCYGDQKFKINSKGHVLYESDKSTRDFDSNSNSNDIETEIEIDDKPYIELEHIMDTDSKLFSYKDKLSEYKLTDNNSIIEEKSMLDVELVIYTKDSDGNKIYIQLYPGTTRPTFGDAINLKNVEDISQ